MSEYGIISEQLNGLTKLINSQFLEVHSRLDMINGKVNKHDEQIQEALIERARNREEQKNMVPNHILSCPLSKKVTEIEDTITGFEECHKRIEKLETNLEDATFILKYPKLFIAGLVVIVVLMVATFLTNNPLQVFLKDKLTIEQPK